MDSEIPTALRQHFDNIAAAEGFTDYTLDQDAGSKHGDGFMGTMVSITISGKRKSSEENVAGDETLQPDRLDLICKIEPTNAARNEQFNTSIVFEREVLCYTAILPVLEHFQREKGLTEDNGFFGFPKCYLATNNPGTNEAIIIMQNLRPLGYNLWDKMKPIGFDNVRLLMEQLGRLHGLSFVLRDQRPEVLDVFRKMDNVLHKMVDTKAVGSILESCYDRAENVLDDEIDKEHIRKYRKICIDVIKECAQSSKAEPFEVMAHGDCWNNNMMFLNNEDGPDKICLLDWQICYFGSPALDLSYFLMSSTTKALRDRHYDEFIRIYYKNLSDIIRACGSEPEKLFTFADLQAQLKEFGVYGVVFAPMLLSIIVSDPKNIANMDELAENMDGDTPKHMATLDASSEITFKERLRDVLADARSFGWI